MNSNDVIEVNNGYVKDEFGNVYPTAPHVIIPLPAFKITPAAAILLAAAAIKTEE